nr:hypothetical protein [Tanacetum cinerariifolium]
VVDPELRTTSASLVKELIPFIDCYIGIVEQPQMDRKDSMLVAQTIPSLDTHHQAPAYRLDVAGLRTPHELQQKPSYEGTDYALFSSEHGHLREIN